MDLKKIMLILSLNRKVANSIFIAKIFEENFYERVQGGYFLIFVRK